MFSKFELIGAGICVALMAIMVYLVELDTLFNGTAQTQEAAVVQSGAVVVPAGAVGPQSQTDALQAASDGKGNITRMVIDDIKVGEGAKVKNGDTVSVHYAGRLQNGTEFDNSRKRGAPLDFTVGAGQVIAGWEEGLVGMQAGGERILVIPPDKAYGDAGIGPIPGGATLVFSVELVAIN